MKLKLIVLLLLTLVLVPTASAQLQQPTTQPGFLQPETTNPNVTVIWPPPVYVLRGQTPIRGSANLPNMTNYFIEFRPVSDDLTLGEGEALWFPVSLPSSVAVQNDVLAIWDTSEVPDGLYEIRLTVNTTGNDTEQAYVRLLRVENNPPPFAVTPTATQPPLLIPTPTQPPRLPTQPPPPTVPPPQPTQDPTPRATINLQAANVRTGDSTLYPAIRSFPQGTVFEIVGLSATGSRWYLIRLPDTSTAWIAPSVVDVTGNLDGLPRVFPPPPPATATPTPIPATATPIPQGNLVAGIVDLSPDDPICGQTFNVGFDVANLGTTNTNASGTVLLQDTRNGTVTESTLGGFPPLNPSQTFRVQMPITVDTFYDETHVLVLIIDPQNQIAETNENDNRQTLSYTLEKGGCP